MPEYFKEKLPNTTVIIDCTEIAVEEPESLHAKAVYCSDYKHHNTYKALVGITPAGGLSFVSELFPGSISDREIVSRCVILNPIFWDKDDEIMADKGFTIRDLLDEIGVKLNIAIFLEGRQKFSAQQLIINQEISSLRIHVDVTSYHTGYLPYRLLTIQVTSCQLYRIANTDRLVMNPKLLFSS